MKCENCNVVIDSEFGHAIKNNQCPACGKGIMKQAKLSSFLSLQALLDNNILDKGVDIDKIASLIIANFEIKQLFKEELKKSDEDNIEVSEEDDDDEEDDTDFEFKQKQKKKSKEILEKMRDEVLSGALKERYDMGEDDSILMTDGGDIASFEMENRDRRTGSLNTIVDGSGGEHSFSRG